MRQATRTCGFILLISVLGVSTAWSADTPTTQPAQKAPTTQPASQPKDTPLLGGPVRQRPTETDARGFSGKRIGGGREMELVAVLETLGLSEEQYDALEDAFAEHRSEANYINRMVNITNTKIKNAKEAGEIERVKELEKQRNEYNRKRPNHNHLMERVDKVLTADQRAELYDMFMSRQPYDAANKVEAALPALDLTAAQLEKIAQLTAQYRQDISAFRRAHTDELVRLYRRTQVGNNDAKRDARKALEAYRKQGPTPKYLQGVSKVVPPAQRKAFWKAFGKPPRGSKAQRDNPPLDL